MTTINDRLVAATEKAEQASQVMQDVTTSDANTLVPTIDPATGGAGLSVPSLLKWQADSAAVVKTEQDASIYCC